MRRSSARGAGIGVLLVPALLAVSGCGTRIDGKYQDAAGLTTYEFKGGKAYIITPISEPLETSYTIRGKEITLNYEGQTVVLTRKSAEVLEGPMGELRKQ